MTTDSNINNKTELINMNINVNSTRNCNPDSDIHLSESDDQTEKNVLSSEIENNAYDLTYPFYDHQEMNFQEMEDESFNNNLDIEIDFSLNKMRKVVDTSDSNNGVDKISFKEAE